LTIRHYILSTELTKNAFFQTVFFGDLKKNKVSDLSNMLDAMSP